MRRLHGNQWDPDTSWAGCRFLGMSLTLDICGHARGPRRGSDQIVYEKSSYYYMVELSVYLGEWRSTYIARSQAYLHLAEE